MTVSPDALTRTSRAARARVCLLDADPDLGRRVPAREFAAARECALAAVRTLGKGAWHPEHERFDEDGMGLLVLDGLLLRRAVLEGRMSCELLGAGDLLQPWRDDDEDASVPVRGEWKVWAAAPVALLDGDVLGRLAAWPSVLGELAGRALRRSRALAVRMAIAQVPSVELRVQLLLWHLADRWGHVAPGGVVLALKPEQETIGNLVGVSRTRVNLALRTLQREDVVRRHPRGWLLRGERPKLLLQRLRPADTASRPSLIGCALTA